jgi:hypothetical protein
MHIDENKKFDKRNVERNIKSKMITQKDFEVYLSKLPDDSDKLFNPEESLEDTKELEMMKDDEISSKKKGLKKKSKTKGK